MYPYLGPSDNFPLCFPRTRGDVPWYFRNPHEAEWFPPHTRGCTLYGFPKSLHCVVSPAHAGMYLTSEIVSNKANGFPRTRGDVPRPELKSILVREFPPHTRGCSTLPSTARIFGGVSPAHAGMYPDRLLLREFTERFPRTRGDVPGVIHGYTPFLLFPPHTRGCTLEVRTCQEQQKVSPAHAGMYPLLVEV